jgi:hypothetical protein
MKNYKIILYDPKTKKTSLIAEMPERRKANRDGLVKLSVINWLKSIFGESWYSGNKNLIGIIEYQLRD